MKQAILFFTLYMALIPIAHAQKNVQVSPLPDQSGFTVESKTKDLGGGFYDHGVASPISNHRGVVATVDGQGRNIVLVWLFDHRGGYALLMIDALTGKSEEFPVPFDTKGDTPFSSILSEGNKLYSLYGSHFVEFDPVLRKFTFVSKATPQMAMSMTADDDGRIWAATYPSSGLVSFDPRTREFKDYKSVNKEKWAQYPRSITADDSGWIYFGLGNAASQIFAFNPVSAEITSILPPAERKLGIASVSRDLNGKVYGQSLSSGDGPWYELYKGKANKVGQYRTRKPKPVITGSQVLVHDKFPDGSLLKSLDLVNRVLVTENPGTRKKNTVTFNYSSDGAIVMGVGTAPDGTIVGGTAFPMRFFNYDLKNDNWVNRPALGQFNALANQNNKVFFAVYNGGYLIDWNPFQPWKGWPKKGTVSNPQYLSVASPTVIRPFRLVAHPDGKTMIMSGSPEYGATGGGLLFWDDKTKQQILLTDKEVVQDQSTMSIVPLKNGKILGGTTTTPGSGGEKKATEAVVYIMDMGSKKIEWQKALFPQAQEYSDMRLMPNGMVYGIKDKKVFFVFDPAKKQVIHEEDLLPKYGRTTAEQSPRIFVEGPKGEIYLLFNDGAIVQINPDNYNLKLIATSPSNIKAGGDYANGRIFFVSGSHLFSYKL
ncbi:hypothetical protein HDC92_003631 [Pedobacter sp. AK017]|uniref:hypothetical protein n=1 Tax=Pedobacter sp. AK017 TaxID=2723073 RepID=UPI0016150D8F|nr:hypothetical protein [Pedobacter sp. AK017]MBB5439935.1 hypothetical protein [Pedobacter sp. AK017]